MINYLRKYWKLFKEINAMKYPHWTTKVDWKKHE